MPSRSPILMDIDADVLLNDDANNGTFYGSGKFQKSIQASITGEMLADKLKHWLKPSTKIFLCVDHQEALYWWDALKIKGATCFHIDAHHDCWSGEIIDKNDRTQVHCGSYLAQAMIDGIVRKMTYVPALFRWIDEEKLDLGYQLRQVRVTKRRWNIRHWNQFIQKKNLKADIVTLCVSPEWFPKKFFPHFVSICKTFGVQEKHIQLVYKDACKKWKDARKGWRQPGEPVIETHFRFPYFDKRELGDVEVKSHRI